MRSTSRIITLLVFALALAACGGNVEPDRLEAGKGITPEITPAATKSFNAGVRLMRQKKYKQAETLFKRMTVQHPTLAGPHANLGLIYSQRKQWNLAVKHLKEAVWRNPKSADNWNALGVAYRHTGSFSKALDSYNRALALNDRHINAVLNLGILHDLYLKNPEQALAQYQRYMELKGGKDKQVNKWIVDLKRRANPPKQQRAKLEKS